jgi:hypothetical protein
MMGRPIAFVWTDEGAMIPLHPRTADKLYVVGERYTLAPYEDRSIASHNHEFGWLHERWMNLPDSLAEQFPTSEHLRKRALVDAGYYNETILDAGSNAAALRAASFIKSRDEFAVVIVRGPVVVTRDAKSQSRRMMDKKTFQESKTAIMEVIDLMISEAHASQRVREMA